MSPNMSVTASIIIPTLLFEPKYLENCLDSLAKQICSETFEVIIVVNDCDNTLSKDLLLPKSETIQDFVKKYEQDLKIKVECKKNNTGFTGATNAGIALAKGEYIVTLNDDTVVAKKWLSRLIKTAQNEQADMVASAIYTPKTAKGATPRKIDTISKELAKTWKIDSLGFRYLIKGKALPITSFRELQKLQPFGPDAAAALYSRKLIDTVTDKYGVFDERFFAYLEDVDLAYRARKAGYTCTVSKKAVVYHFKHVTSSSMSRFKAKHDMQNWWRLILKNYTVSDLMKHFPSILLERARNLSGYLKTAKD